MSPPTSQPLRILIVRIGAMGDVLHAMPAVAGLRKALPACSIGWAIEPHWQPLLQAADGTMPLVNRVHQVPTRQWKQHPLSPPTLRGIWQLRRQLHAQRYDLCFDLQGSIKSALTGWISGAGRVVGASNPRESAARKFYTDTVAITEANVIDQARQMLSVAVSREIALAPVSLPVDPAGERWCGHLLQQLSITDNSAVLLAPTAGWGAKEWGAARYGELARQLIRAGFPVLVNKATEAPPGVAEAVASASRSHLVASTLPEMVALTRRMRLVVGGDTGPMHLAAALGRPVVALFGPTDPARNGPCFPGAKVQVLRNPASLTSHKRLSATEPGLAAITVEEVLAACLQALGPA